MATNTANGSARKNYIPRETVDEICGRNDIVEVILECGVPLRAAGRDYKALCPFHDEKNTLFYGVARKAGILLFWVPNRRKCYQFFAEA